MTAALVYSCDSDSESGSEDAMSCNYTLPEGQAYGSEEPGYSFWTSPTGYASEDPTDGAIPAFILVSGYSTQYTNKTYAYLDTWLMINSSAGTVTAAACGLWFCVQAYETSINNGILTQTITGNYSEANLTEENLTEVLESNGWANITNVPEDIQRDATYGVYGDVLIAFGTNPIFTDATVYYGSPIPTFYGYNSTTARSLQSIPDYNAWIDQFALGMSNNVRSTGFSTTPESTYAGQVLTSTPYVHVRWPWLAFPAAMVVASLLFLLACIWQTSHLNVDPLKGDALALLLASVDVDIQRESASRWKIAGEKVWLESEGNGVFRRLEVQKA